MIRDQKQSGFLTFWKQKARALKVQAYALYFAYRDPRVAWYKKAFIALVVAYTFSPIDLIPDFIPVLGYLDDLVIVPLGVYLSIKMIPPAVMDESRAKAQEHVNEGKPLFKFMGPVIVGIWILAILLVGWLVWRAIQP